MLVVPGVFFSFNTHLPYGTCRSLLLKTRWSLWLKQETNNEFYTPDTEGYMHVMLPGCNKNYNFLFGAWSHFLRLKRIEFNAPDTDLSYLGVIKIFHFGMVAFFVHCIIGQSKLCCFLVDTEASLTVFFFLSKYCTFLLQWTRKSTLLCVGVSDMPLGENHL